MVEMNLKIVFLSKNLKIVRKKKMKKKEKKFTDEMHKRFGKRFHEEQKFVLSQMNTSSTSWLRVLPLLTSPNLPLLYSSSFLSFITKT